MVNFVFWMVHECAWILFSSLLTLYSLCPRTQQSKKGCCWISYDTHESVRLLFAPSQLWLLSASDWNQPYRVVILVSHSDLFIDQTTVRRQTWCLTLGNKTRPFDSCLCSPQVQGFDLLCKAHKGRTTLVLRFKEGNFGLVVALCGIWIRRPIEVCSHVQHFWWDSWGTGLKTIMRFRSNPRVKPRTNILVAQRP